MRTSSGLALVAAAPRLALAGALALLAVAALVGTLRYERRASAADTTYQDAVLADNPSAYYRLGESSGTTAVDSSANAMDGVYSASDVTYGVTGAPLGDADTSVHFESTGAMVASTANVPASTDPATYEVWFRSTAYPFSERLSGPAFDVALYYGTLYLPQWGSFGTSGLNDGAWHLLDITDDGAGNVGVWVDGSPESKFTISTSGTGVAGLILGNTGRVSGTTSGDIDEAAVYPSVLSPTRCWSWLWRSGWQDWRWRRGCSCGDGSRPGDRGPLPGAISAVRINRGLSIQ
jgi:hypothetical protein